MSQQESTEQPRPALSRKPSFDSQNAADTFANFVKEVFKGLREER